MCKRTADSHVVQGRAVGEMMRNYRQAVAVSGTHGKTTTTSMLTEILLQAQTDPTISVGGMLDSIQGNIRIWQLRLVCDGSL